ncbi:MAG: protein translocase subunit SecD [Dehalococcoidales bacterium]|nr:protein translocase subunit SecD [Dehalococcoidales bacterium]
MAKRRNTLVFVMALIIFVLAALIVFPIEEGVWGKKGLRLGLDLQGGIHIVYKADLSAIEVDGRDEALYGAMAVLSNRINPLGVTEPVIQKQGSDRILVELPGVTITNEEKERLARVDLLEFGELVTGNETAKWEVKWGNELRKWKPATAIIDGQEKALTSRYFKENTYVGQDNMGRIQLYFEWDEEGSQLSQEITGRLIGQPLAIFDGNEPLLGENDIPIAPTIQDMITDRGVITGLSLKEATRLSQQLNFGRLPVPLEIIYDQTVSPILGSNFVSLSVKAGLIGTLVVMLFMILYYRVPGVLASLALIFYGVLVMALFKLFAITLTLAGVGGFIVSLGMAIDASVLIFERMKEELIIGQTLGAAIEAGFKRAWSAIWDSNFTTFVVCGVLFWLGGLISPPVKGFAVTLFIGVAVSMFTAVVVTRTWLRLFPGTSLASRTWLFSPHQGGK